MALPENTASANLNQAILHWGAVGFLGAALIMMIFLTNRTEQRAAEYLREQNRILREELIPVMREQRDALRVLTGSRPVQ